jgi:hypothetical protein
VTLSTKVDALAARIAVAVKALRDDPRWTDTRTPKVHASSHAANGADPITPAEIGAAADSAVVHTSGNETINGTKIFGSPPQVPVGTQLTHPVRRDDARLTDARPPAAELANVANGWLQLDATVKVPQNLLPAVAIVDFLGAVATQTAMLALSGQRGDWCTRTDRGTDWQLIADTPTQLASWREMNYPGSPVASVNGRTGSVTGLAEQANLTSGLAGKADTVHGHAGTDLTSTVPTNRLPGAGPTAYGILRLAGDLGGTSAEPTVPALADLADSAKPIFVGDATTNTTIPTVAWTSIALNAEEVDTHGGHSLTVSNSRYVCQRAGWYRVNGGTYFQGGTGGSTRAVRIAVNGTGLTHTQANAAATDAVSVSTLPVLIFLALNAYVELQAYQNSGANRTTLGTQTTLCVEWARAA